MYRIIRRIGSYLLLLFAVTAVFVSVRLAAGGSKSVPATVMDDPLLPRIKINGTILHAKTYGDPDAPLVIVVHGGPGGNYSDLLDLHRLEDHYFVVFYDQLGAGLSERGRENRLTLEYAVDELDGVIKHYAKKRPVRLIGHSWGAMLCAAYVGRHPSKVRQVVLAEPGALDNAGLQRFLQRTDTLTKHPAYYWHLLQALLDTFGMEAPDRFARADYVFAKMAAFFARSPQAGYYCDHHTNHKRTAKIAVQKVRFGSEAYSTLFTPQTDLSTITSNAKNYAGDVLFLSAECSRRIGTGYQRRQMHIFSKAKLVEIPNAGHNMFFDNPEQSLATVRNFFTGN